MPLKLGSTPKERNLRLEVTGFRFRSWCLPDGAEALSHFAKADFLMSLSRGFGAREAGAVWPDEANFKCSSSSISSVGGEFHGFDHV